MPLTPEKFAEITRRVEARKAALAAAKVKPPRPKVVVSETRNAEGRPEIVRDADVVVSRGDVNALRRGSEVVEVRRPDPDWLDGPAPRGTGRVGVDYRRVDYFKAEQHNREEAERRQREALRGADDMGVWGSRADD
jgi:hypothetical protein